MKIYINSINQLQFDVSFIKSRRFDSLAFFIYKVSSLQKERNTLLESVSKQRTKARNELLKNLNPIIKDYMNEKKIRMVVDKKSLLLADENLNITNEIMDFLGKNKFWSFIISEKYLIIYVQIFPFEILKEK